jgi:hypothetical protein
LLERERERLLAVLQSRTATHAERTRARQTLEAELPPSEWPESLRGSQSNGLTPSESEHESPAPTARPTEDG